MFSGLGVVMLEPEAPSIETDTQTDRHTDRTAWVYNTILCVD